MMPGDFGAQPRFRVGPGPGERVAPQFVDSDVFASQGMVHARHMVAVGLTRMSHPERVEFGVGRQFFPGIERLGVLPHDIQRDSYAADGHVEVPGDIGVAESGLEGLHLRGAEAAAIERDLIEALTA